MKQTLIKIFISWLLLLSIYNIWNMVNISSANNSYATNPYNNSIKITVKHRITSIINKVTSKKEKLWTSKYNDYVSLLIVKLSSLKDEYKNNTGISESSRTKIINIIWYLEYEFSKLLSDSLVSSSTSSTSSSSTSSSSSSSWGVKDLCAAWRYYASPDSTTINGKRTYVAYKSTDYEAYWRSKSWKFDIDWLTWNKKIVWSTNYRNWGQVNFYVDAYCIKSWQIAVWYYEDFEYSIDTCNWWIFYTWQSAALVNKTNKTADDRYKYVIPSSFQWTIKIVWYELTNSRRVFTTTASCFEDWPHVWWKINFRYDWWAGASWEEWTCWDTVFSCSKWTIAWQKWYETAWFSPPISLSCTNTNPYSCSWWSLLQWACNTASWCKASWNCWTKLCYWTSTNWWLYKSWILVK